MAFKIGDKVKVLNNDHSPNHYMVIGSTAEVIGLYPSGYRLMLKGEITSASTSQSVNPLCVEKVSDMFEDQWHLNDGKVTIPDDADKLEKDGSVVAFRKRKPVVFSFGDYVRSYGNSNSTQYIFIKYNEYDKTRCTVAGVAGVWEDQRVYLFTKV